jgi:choline-sulfatase
MLMDRPNFLVILSDQHNPHLAGYAGSNLVRTPNLDRLAATGVSFDSTYCPAPLCVPSRMAFMAGQYPCDLQIWTNEGVLDPHIPTFAHQLSLAGWETTLCGRMHFNGPDQHHGFEHRLAGDVSGAADPAPGGLFENIWSPAGCGQQYTGLLDDAVGPGQAAYAAYDADVTARARTYLRERPTDKPFCLVVGMLLPHNPYVCPPSLFEEYMDLLPSLENVGILPDEEHPAVRALRQYRGTDRITPEQARRARAAYFGLITQMDENLGRILDELSAQGLDDNTIIAYTSDHGDMAGEHGLWWKDCFYEGSVRVPMVWSWPQQFRTDSSVPEAVSLLDIGETLIDLAGAEPLPGSRGHSLRPLLTAGAEATDWPDVAFAETCALGQRPARMIRSGRWKLNVYHGYEHPQLFDLETDPDENRDLGTSPDHAEVRQELLTRVMDNWSGERIEQQVRQHSAGRAIVRKWAASHPTGQSERWAMPTGVNYRTQE